jgi:hypothetical protein
MVNPVKYQFEAAEGEREITIEPVYEEITGGDLFPTGRYILSDANGDTGEIRFDGELFEWEWNGARPLDSESISRIRRFIQEYNEPELAGYLD